MTQGLQERPLLVDRDVQLLLGQGPSPFDGPLPQPLQPRPRRSEAVGIGRAHHRAVGVPQVELLLHVRADLDAVDGHVVVRAVDLDVGQHDPAQPGAHHQGAMDPHAAHVDIAECRAAQADTLERRSGHLPVRVPLGVLGFAHTSVG